LILLGRAGTKGAAPQRYISPRRRAECRGLQRWWAPVAPARPAMHGPIAAAT
jgi:hypothetical protein